MFCAENLACSCKRRERRRCCIREGKWTTLITVAKAPWIALEHAILHSNVDRSTHGSLQALRKTLKAVCGLGKDSYRARRRLADTVYLWVFGGLCPVSSPGFMLSLSRGVYISRSSMFNFYNSTDMFKSDGDTFDASHFGPAVIARPRMSKEAPTSTITISLLFSLLCRAEYSTDTVVVN